MLRRVVVVVEGLLLVLAIVVVAAAVTRASPTLHSEVVGDLSVTVEVNASGSDPSVAEQQSTATAIAKLQEMKPAIVGWSLPRSTYEKGLVSVTDESGRRLMSGPPLDAWLVQTTAPPQGGWSRIKGIVVIDASSGKVKSASIVSNNAP